MTVATVEEEVPGSFCRLDPEERIYIKNYYTVCPGRSDPF